MKGDLPNLIVIGAMKSGTTSLHDYLNIHPDIQMSEPKELDFFIDPKEEERSGQSTYPNGFDWYRSHFDGKYLVRGESSQNYSKSHKFPSSPELIREHLEDVKLIYILRDPVERFLSNISEIQFGSSFEGSAESYEKRGIKELSTDLIIETGYYSKHLKAFLKFFKEEEIKVIFLEDLLSDRVGVMNEIFDFLGIQKIDDDEAFSFESNVSAQKFTEGSLLRKVLKNPSGKKISRLLSRDLKDSLKSKRLIQKLVYKNVKKGALSEILRTKLIDIYRDDINNLKDLLGLSDVPFKNFRK